MLLLLPWVRTWVFHYSLESPAQRAIILLLGDDFFIVGCCVLSQVHLAYSSETILWSTVDYLDELLGSPIRDLSYVWRLFLISIEPNARRPILAASRPSTSIKNQRSLLASFPYLYISKFVIESPAHPCKETINEWVTFVYIPWKARPPQTETIGRASSQSNFVRALYLYRRIIGINADNCKLALK